MPKKSKAQKVKSSQRSPQPAPVASPATSLQPGVGHFWARGDGFRLALISVPEETGNGIEAVLCVVDERRDGLFKIQSAQFENGETVAEMMKSGPFKWVRGDADQSRKTVGIGLRVLDALDRQPPEGFDRVEALLGDVRKTALPPGMYTCPVFDTPLPPDAVETILDNARKEIDDYLVSDRAEHKRNLGIKRRHFALPIHLRLKNAFVESENLSLSPAGWDAFERAHPTESVSEAVGLMLVQDVLKGVVYGLEKFLSDSAVPNPRITDEHVLKALEILKTAVEEDRDLKAVDPYEVNFVLEGLDEGLALVKQIFREEVKNDPDPKALLSGIDWILVAARRRAGRDLTKRNYVQYLADYV